MSSSKVLLLLRFMLNAIALTLCRPVSPKRQKLSKRKRCESPPPRASSKSTLSPLVVSPFSWMLGSLVMTNVPSATWKVSVSRFGFSSAITAGEDSARAAAHVQRALEPGMRSRVIADGWHIVKAPAVGSRLESTAS